MVQKVSKPVLGLSAILVVQSFLCLDLLSRGCVVRFPHVATTVFAIEKSSVVATGSLEKSWSGTGDGNTVVSTPLLLPPPLSTASSVVAESSTKFQGYNGVGITAPAPLLLPPPLSLNGSHVSTAPWDPLSVATAGDGTALTQFLSSCSQDISEFCSDTIPIRECLLRQQKVTTLSMQCNNVLDPCQKWGVQNARAHLHEKRGRDCLSSLLYIDRVTNHDSMIMEDLLETIDRAATEVGAVYWLTAGSSIGGLLHHSRILWDDDIDIYVLRQDMNKFFDALRSNHLKVHDRHAGLVWKIFNPETVTVKHKEFGWPSIDAFPINCESDNTCTEPAYLGRTIPVHQPIDWVFPLVRRPFGRLSLPFPRRLHDLVVDRYSTGVREKCVIGGFDHKMEQYFRKLKQEMNCLDLYWKPAFTEELAHTPWPNHSDFAVENIMDGRTLLSSVTFDRGIEVRRSYADGLLNVHDNQITYTLPLIEAHPSVASSDINYLRPVPYLLQDRESYARNVANRSAKKLNEEVLPMLNRVEVSNAYSTRRGQQDGAAPDVLNVVFWNAERGTNWPALNDFVTEIDILILNEMDWGMARSGNTHTTVDMHHKLQMNYAYGVEFMELTNGNAKEINETRGLTNDVGYHGNVVMSKWPIGETKIIRLHELYDHLYAAKDATGKMDAGERRLGGRMALFSVTTLGGTGQRLLVVSAHGQGGGKRIKLLQDARLICKEMMTYTNITAYLLGGDIAGSLATELQSTCQTLPLQSTNNYNPNGRRPIPTWRVDCPNGQYPRARFERGDWLLAKGNIEIVSDTVKTIHPYRKTSDGLYECISDHSIIALNAKIVNKPQNQGNNNITKKEE